MKVHYGFEELGTIRNPVVTTGSFDGVHVGHKTIINRINEIAKEINGESVLITFYPHPRKVLYPETEGKDLLFINSQKEKLELLAKSGLDHLVIVRFSLEFSKITSEEFIKGILLGKLHAKCIVVGFNHHFGHNRAGDYEYLYRLSKKEGFRVEEIPEQDIQHETVSSTTIRKALQDGRIQRANAYLDHFYIIIGGLGKGHHIFSEANFPMLTVQLEEVGKLIPPDGVYAVGVEWGPSKFKGLAVISRSIVDSRPFGVTVQVHILNFDYHFPDADAIVLFHKRVRESFDTSTPAIIGRQLTNDLEYVHELIF
ncbi:MAG TPA: riboflavin kinase [Williamwhitmania sp.]|nr:riboflavin kinase [Williamwhitmania sp.]